MRNLPPERAKWMRLRMGILCGIMALGLGGVVSGAYRVQVKMYQGTGEFGVQVFSSP